MKISTRFNKMDYIFLIPERVIPCRERERERERSREGQWREERGGGNSETELVGRKDGRARSK